MGLTVSPSTHLANQGSRNSPYVRNSQLAPAKLYVLEKQGSLTPVTSVEFDVVAREGSFRDVTQANYELRGQSSTFLRWALTRLGSNLPEAVKGEATTKFNSVSPKTLSFDIILRADSPINFIGTHDGRGIRGSTRAFDTQDLKIKVAALQSLCYPRAVAWLNPPLCQLVVLGLYNIECYVMSVIVTWHNQWDVVAGIPMGCDIQMEVLMHQYPIREQVLAGAGFDTKQIGYGGTTQSTGLAGVTATQEGGGRITVAQTPFSTGSTGLAINP